MLALILAGWCVFTDGMTAKNGKREAAMDGDSVGRGSRLRTIPQVLAERPALRSAGKQQDRWIRRTIYERRIPYYKSGGRVLVDLADIDAYLVGQRIEASAAGGSETGDVQ